MNKYDLYPELFLDRDTNPNTCAEWLRDKAYGRSGDFSIVESHMAERDIDIRAYEFAAKVIEGCRKKESE
jgi:hypothetical protein